MAGTISLVSVTDENLVSQVEVLAVSIIAYAKPDRPIDYHVLYWGPDSPAVERLANFKAGPLRMIVHRVENPMGNLGNLRHLTPATFLRFAVPDSFPDLERIIYLDVDMVALSDIGELYDTDLKGRGLGTVVDAALWLRRNSGNRPIQTTDFQGFADDYFKRALPGVDAADYDQYVNGGLQVMDVQRLRALNYSQITQSYVIDRNKRLYWRDQDTLNGNFWNEMTRIDPRWNVTITALVTSMSKYKPGFQQDTVRAQKSGPKLVHYISKTKPWRASRPDPYSHYWWLFARYAPSYPELHAFHRKWLADRRKIALNQPGPITYWKTRDARRRLAAAGLVQQSPVRNG